ncbi:MAG TPA: adenylate/guanylate cyclase domain-containing protein [Stellaceae bacterium]|nr:adenylate/guanylate cyclase domain-containing protein [Stellaceae bacterium]
MADHDSGPSVPPPLERRLATILSADVANYSRLMAENEEQTLLTFRGHKEIFESLVSTHRGRVFNTAGDAILAEFASAVEAVRCATDIQAALRTRNAQLPPAQQVQFRIGINLGDVMLQGSDLLGDGVNVAARIQAAAEPGGICIAGSVYDQIRNKLSLSFRTLGERRYKNIPEAIRTFAIVDADTPRSPRGRSGHRWRRAAAFLLFAAAVLGSGLWVWSANERRVPPERASSAEVSTTMVAPAKPATLAPAATGPERAETTSDGRSDAITDPDGFYSGPLCFGATDRLPARCFRGEATVSLGTIKGQWSGREEKVVMKVAGEVAASGAVTIELHSENAEGMRLTTVDLVGSVHNGRLEATGTFRNGRSANLNWHRNERP